MIVGNLGGDRGRVQHLEHHYREFDKEPLPLNELVRLCNDGLDASPKIVANSGASQSA